MKDKKVVLISVLSALLLVLVVIYFLKGNSKQENVEKIQTLVEQNDEKNLKEYERFFALPKHSSLQIDKNAKLSDDKDELKAQILELRAKNQLLYDDNLGLVNKNYEIALALDDEKAKIKEIKHQLQTKNLEAINESEKQHYQNINELTRRINELQKENLNTIKDYEQKLVNLENEIEKLQSSLRNKDMLTNDEVAKATKTERIKNSSLAEKNLYLINEIEKLKQNTNIHTQKLLDDISSRKTENDKLKKMILEKENLINQILAKHTAEIIDFDKKAQIQIKKLKEENNKIKQDNENDISNVKNQYQLEISKLNEQIKKLIDDKNNTNDNVKSLIVQKKDEQIALLQTQLAKQKSEQTKTTNLSDKDKQNYKILNDKIILLERQNKELKEAKNGLDDTSSLIEKIQIENKKLQEQNTILQDELKQANVKLNDFSNKNYDLIISEQNEKIKNYQVDNETLKTSLKETEDRLNSTQKQLELSMNENQMQDYENKNNLRKTQKELDDKGKELAKLENLNKDLIKENASLKMQVSGLKDYEDLVTSLNKEISTLKSTNAKQEQKIGVLSKLNDEYKTSLDDKSTKLNDTNSDLNKKLNDAKKEIINLTAIKEENESLIKTLKSDSSNYAKLQKEILELKSKYEKEKSELNISFEENLSKLSKINDSLKSQVSTINSQNQSLKLENLKITNQINEDKQALNKTINDIKAKNLSLTNSNKDLQNKVKELENIQANISSLDEKIATLQKENISLQEQNNKLKEQNTLVKSQTQIALANQDKKSLNELNALSNKLSELNANYKNLDTKYSKAKDDIAKINSEKLEYEEKLKASQIKIKELLAYQENSHKNSDNLLSKMGDYEEKITKNQTELKQLKQEKDELIKQNAKLLAQNDDLRLKLDEITQNSSLSNDENAKLLSQSTEALKQMQDKINELENKLASKQNTKTDDKKGGFKQSLLTTIVCDDLKSGAKDLSKTCKTNIQNALKTAQASDIYEIEPVVDDGGFTSLNTLKRQGIIPQSEFERLTKFANFGLGRDRGQKASEFIKSINKDANVYLSKELTIKPDKRGFILRIYR